MAWRFRRSVQVIPGVRLNFTNRGVSTTLGAKGGRVTFGRGRTTHTIGIPGTGISYSSTTRHRTRQAQPISWRRIWSLIGVVCLLAAIGFYSKGAAAAGSWALFVSLLTALPHFAPAIPRLLRIVRNVSAARERMRANEADRQRQVTRQAILARDADEYVWRPQSANQEVQLRVEHEADEVALRAETAARSAAEAEEAVRLRIQQDKLRVLLFLARDDGAVRAKERDVIVGYLRSQSGFEDASDSWLRRMHTKVDRDSEDAAVEAVARLGSVGAIDQAMIGATEALVKLTKRISPAQLNVLTMLRHERARGSWRSARIPEAEDRDDRADVRRVL